MDPDATLADIQWSLENGESGAEIRDMCSDLADWIRRGGFEPNWGVAPQATEFYRKHCKLAQ